MPSYHQTLEDAALGVETVPANVAGSTVNGAGVDMLGWDSVAFLAQIGGGANSSTLIMVAQGSANANFSGAVNITGAATVSIANTAATANVVVAVDVYRPTNRYVRAQVVIGGTNTTFGVISARRRGASRLPAALATNFQYVKAVEN